MSSSKHPTDVPLIQLTKPGGTKTSLGTGAVTYNTSSETQEPKTIISKLEEAWSHRFWPPPVTIVKRLKLDKHLAAAIKDLVTLLLAEVNQHDVDAAPDLFARKIKMEMDEAHNSTNRYRSRGNWHVSCVSHGGTCVSAIHAIQLEAGKWSITIFYA